MPGPAERFPDNQHLTSYLVLVPQEDSSAGRQRFEHLTRHGSRLTRFPLVEAAKTASCTDPHLERAYRRLDSIWSKLSPRGSEMQRA